MAAAPVRDAPTRPSLPAETPKWFREAMDQYVRETEAWGREIAFALRQAQAEIAKLKGI